MRRRAFVSVIALLSAGSTCVAATAKPHGWYLGRSGSLAAGAAAHGFPLFGPGFDAPAPPLPKTWRVIWDYRCDKPGQRPGLEITVNPPSTNDWKPRAPLATVLKDRDDSGLGVRTQHQSGHLWVFAFTACDLDYLIEFWR